MITLAKFSVELLLPDLGLGMPRLNLKTDEGSYSVKADSHRLECLKRNQRCVACQLEGVEWHLQVSVQQEPRVAVNCFVSECPWCALQRKPMKVGKETPHLNLYGYRDGKRVLMTQDHIMPKHAGGADHIDNLQTMCSQCNSFKGGMLPNEYKQYIERTLHSGRMAGRSFPAERLSAIQLSTDNETYSHDCAAE